MGPILTLTTEQLTGVSKGLSRKATAWTGYPGSGKTEVIKHLYQKLGTVADWFDVICFSRIGRADMRRKIGEKQGVRTLHGLAWNLNANHYNKSRDRQEEGGKTWPVMEGRHRRLVEIAAKQFYDPLKGRFDQDQLTAIDDCTALVPLIQAHCFPYTDTSALLTFAREYGKEPSDPRFVQTQMRTIMRWVVKGLNESESQAHTGGRRLKISEGFEFSDLTYNMALHPTMRMFSDRCKGIIVDEVQDLTPCDMLCLERRMNPDSKIILVGDPAQAIYRFRGSPSTMYGDMVRRFGAEVCPMRTSFRLPRAVLDLARQWAPDLTISKDAIDGACDIVDMMDLRGRVGPGTAVITMTNAQAVRWAYFLLRHGIAAIVMGTKISVDMSMLVDQLAAVPGFRFDELMLHLEAWQTRQEMLMRKSHPHNPDAYIQAGKERASSLAYIYEGALEEGVSDVAGLKNRIRRLFVSDDSDVHGKAVVCMTAWKAKGSEFEHVVVEESDIVGVKGTSAEEIEQYRNAQYVMVTRTKNRLDIIREGHLLKNEDRW